MALILSSASSANSLMTVDKADRDLPADEIIHGRRHALDRIDPPGRVGPRAPVKPAAAPVAPNGQRRYR